MNIFKCEKCGSMVIKINDAACTPVCCGDSMTALEPGTSDGAHEKHVPVVEVNGNKVTVKVGEVEHPMTEEHYISHVVLETDAGIQIAELHPGDKPEAVFSVVKGASVIAAYAYCNLHGLWKS